MDFSAPWHSRQCSASTGRTFVSKNSSSAGFGLLAVGGTSPARAVGKLAAIVTISPHSTGAIRKDLHNRKRGWLNAAAEAAAAEVKRDFREWNKYIKARK